MRNRSSDEMFRYFINGLDQKLQAQLRYAYFRSQMIDEEKHRREMEQMKQEIIDEVMSRISLMIDTSDAADKIKELRDLLDSLGI